MWPGGATIYFLGANLRYIAPQFETFFVTLGGATIRNVAEGGATKRKNSPCGTKFTNECVS